MLHQFPRVMKQSVVGGGCWPRRARALAALQSPISSPVWLLETMNDWSRLLRLVLLLRVLSTVVWRKPWENARKGDLPGLIKWALTKGGFISDCPLVVTPRSPLSSPVRSSRTPRLRTPWRRHLPQASKDRANTVLYWLGTHCRGCRNGRQLPAARITHFLNRGKYPDSA